MADPRKPIRRPDDAEQEAVRQIVYAHLTECTIRGTRALRCTGASFVIMGTGMWMAEMAEMDSKATAQMLRALADLYDPASNPAQKARAEKKRRAAVDRLLGALDLSMATPGGRA